MKKKKKQKYYLEGMNVRKVALTGKPATGIEFHFIKNTDGVDDGANVTLNASIVKSFAVTTNHYIRGAVYIPDTFDKQEQALTAESIEECAFTFMENGQGINFEHKDDMWECVVVESFIVRSDNYVENGVKIAKGSWIITVKIPEMVFALVESGAIKGFSMEGKAKMLVPVSKSITDDSLVDSLMNIYGFEGSSDEFVTLLKGKTDQTVIKNINNGEKSMKFNDEQIAFLKSTDAGLAVIATVEAANKPATKPEMITVEKSVIEQLIEDVKVLKSDNVVAPVVKPEPTVEPKPDPAKTDVPVAKSMKDVLAENAKLEALLAKKDGVDVDVIKSTVNPNAGEPVTDPYVKVSKSEVTLPTVNVS